MRYSNWGIIDLLLGYVVAGEMVKTTEVYHRIIAWLSSCLAHRLPHR